MLREYVVETRRTACLVFKEAKERIIIRPVCMTLFMLDYFRKKLGLTRKLEDACVLKNGGSFKSEVSNKNVFNVVYIYNNLKILKYLISYVINNCNNQCLPRKEISNLFWNNLYKILKKLTYCALKK